MLQSTRRVIRVIVACNEFLSCGQYCVQIYSWLVFRHQAVRRKLANFSLKAEKLRLTAI